MSIFDQPEPRYTELTESDKAYLDTLNIKTDGYYGMVAILNDNGPVFFLDSFGGGKEYPDTHPYRAPAFYIHTPPSDEEVATLVKLSEIVRRVGDYKISRYVEKKERAQS